MPDETAMGAAVRLTIAMEAAAALAAHVRLSTEELDVDPQVRSLLEDIAGELVNDAATAGAAGQPIVGDGSRLPAPGHRSVENPGRIGDWDQVDEAILQGVGRLSMAITDAFRAATESLDGLGERLGTQAPAFSTSAPVPAGWRSPPHGRFRLCE